MSQAKKKSERILYESQSFLLIGVVYLALSTYASRLTIRSSPRVRDMKCLAPPAEQLFRSINHTAVNLTTTLYAIAPHCAANMSNVEQRPFVPAKKVHSDYPVRISPSLRCCANANMAV